MIGLIALAAVTWLLGYPMEQDSKGILSPSVMPFDFVLSRTVRNGHVILNIKAINRNDRSQCVFGGLVDGSASNEMDIHIRIGEKNLRYRPAGYLPDPGKDYAIRPGQSFTTTYDLNNIFKGLDGRKLPPGQWRARVGFRFHTCGLDDWALRTTDWLAI